VEGRVDLTANAGSRRLVQTPVLRLSTAHRRRCRRDVALYRQARKRLRLGGDGALYFYLARSSSGVD
jgi:DNA-nicking Smr family endonuclease